MESYRRAVSAHWRRVYNFAFRMTLHADSAVEVTRETFMRAFVGLEKLPAVPAQAEAWLLRIAAHVVERRTASEPQVSFEMLDDTLRSEATRTDVVHLLSAPERNFLLWELKQGCMTAVLNCLPLGERSAFILHVILGYSEEVAAQALGTTRSAVKVRLSRARKKVTDYLAPRCENVDPRNPCRCPSRLGVAMSRGFLGPQPGAEVSLRPAFGRYGTGDDTPLRDVMAIYHSLPEPDAPTDLGADILGRVDRGEWAGLRKKG